MTVLFLVKKAIFLTLIISMPLVLVAVGVGLIIGLLQAVMQLQDQALPFGVKLVVSVMVLIVAGPWMAVQLTQFSDTLFSQIATIGKQ